MAGFRLEWFEGQPVEGAGLLGYPLDRSSVAGGGEDGEVAGFSQQLDGGGDGLGHIVYGPKGDAVEFCLQGFGASGMDFGIQAEGSDGFAEEGGFLVLGFGQGHLHFGTHQGYGNSGEACATAEIQ